MREDAVEEVLLSEMRKRGGMSFKIVPIVAGLPDRMVVWPWGEIELVELKTTSGQLRPAQRVLHRRLAKRGVIVPVLYGSDEVRHWVRTRKQRTETQVDTVSAGQPRVDSSNQRITGAGGPR